MSIETIDCAALGCETELLPVSFDTCLPLLKYNEIRRLYITNDEQPFTNWTDPAEWADRINETSSDLDAIRELIVLGSLEVEFGERVRISDGRFAFLPKTFTLTARVDDNNDTNYTFLRSTSCNRAYRAWYETSDGDLYGGNEGILVVLQGREPIGDDPETFRPLEFVGEWTSNIDPLRITSPIA